MHQTLLTMSMEVQPRNLDAIIDHIQHLKNTVAKPPGAAEDVDIYDQLGSALPSLHFLSIMVFTDERYDPLLTVEINFDGDAACFLPQLEIPALEPSLRKMIGCCKRPTDGTGDMYDAITADGSKIPLTPFLETRIVRPAAFHQGNRGLDRNRILAEQALFTQAQIELKSPEFFHTGDAKAIHQRLLEKLIVAFPWLATPEPERWTKAERFADFARLFGFVALTLACLSAPGMIMAWSYCL